MMVVMYRVEEEHRKLEDEKRALEEDRTRAYESGTAHTVQLFRINQMLPIFRMFGCKNAT
jgi:hypothetical protein